MAITVSVASSMLLGYQLRDSFSGKRAGSGVISGRVTDAAGQPVPDVLVVPLWETPSRGGIRVGPVSVLLGSITDAAGHFRLRQLPAGSYYLAAVPRNAVRNRQLMVNQGSYRFGYAITYYRAAARVSDAKMVAVDGNTVAAADITLAAAQLAEITGHVFGSNGRPVQGGALGVAHGDNLFGVDSIAVPIRQDGTFVVKGVPPGTYFLQFREGVWPPPKDVLPKVSGAKVIVSDADVTPVRVAPIKMVRVSGRLVLDASQRTLQSSEIKVTAVPTDWNGIPDRSGKE